MRARFDPWDLVCEGHHQTKGTGKNGLLISTCRHEHPALAIKDLSVMR